MSNSRPVAYSYDAGFHCPSDAMDRFGWCEDHNQLACGTCFTDSEGNNVGATFSWDEHICGISCDTCHEYIVEHPDTNGLKCSECRKTWDSGMELIEPKKIQILRTENNGKLPSIMYPQVVVYLDRDNSQMCADCASTPDPINPVTGYVFLGEEEEIDGLIIPTLCDNCSQPIDPAIVV